MSPSHRSTARPDLTKLIATHRKVRNALEDAQEGRDVQSVLAALTHARNDDRAGLDELLADLKADSPSDLLDVMRMLILSSGYTALTWAGGLTASGGVRFSERDVLSTSWSSVEWHDDDVADEVIEAG